MHILYLVGQFPSVTETFIEREIQGLRQKGIEITVASIKHFSFGEWRSTLEFVRKGWSHCNALRDDVPMKTYCGALWRSGQTMQLLQGIDHVHAGFLGVPSIVAWMISITEGIPFSCSAHARDLYVASTPGIVLREARFVTTCTAINLAYLQELFPDTSVQLIRHGLSPSERRVEIAANHSKPCRMIAVGRLVEKKGYPLLLDACRMLADNSLHFELTIVGNGPLKDGIERCIGEKNLKDQVRMRPFQPKDQILDLMRESDLLIVPSIVSADGDREGVPNVILEAFSVGLPVIAADSGAVHEAVIPEKTGWLVPQGDPMALAESIASAWSEWRGRQVLSANAITHLEKEFAPDVWLEKLEDLFRRCQ